MKDIFNFEAEPFEFDSEFDEYEEGQPTKPCQCHKQSASSAELIEEYQEEQPDSYSEYTEEYESDYEAEPLETYSEFEETGELFEEYEDHEDSPTRPPRTPQPGTGTIPVGPIRVQIPCRVGQDDLADLSVSLGLLNTARQRFPRRVRGARIGVLAVVNRMINRSSRSGFYVKQGCTGRNLRRLAARVRRLRWPQSMRAIRQRLINSILQAARRAP